MKITKLSTLVILTLLVLFSNKLHAQSSADSFIGMWALDLDYESSKAGWLEIKQEEGYLDADILWRWGSVHPVEFVFESEGHLILTSSRNENRKNKDGEIVRKQRITNWVDIQKQGDNTITGKAVYPNSNGLGIESVSFTGKRIPVSKETPSLEKIVFGKPIKLLAKNDLTAWELLEKGAVNGWSVKKSVLINDPVQKEGEAHIHYGNIRTSELFEDFQLKLEVNVPAGSNSGIYLRGIYEIQVSDSYEKPLDSHNMGALYSRITPSEAAEKPAGEWQEMNITLYKRHLTVVLNGKTIIDNQPVMGVTGGAITADEFIPGPVYLQGDHGKVSYRKIILTPIIE